MSKKKKTEKIEIPAELLLESVDEVNRLVTGHTMILESVKELLHKYVKAGIPHNDAARMALELSNRAAQKANGLVKHSDEDTTNEKPEQKDEEAGNE